MEKNAKQALIKKYDAEARELDTPTWVATNDDVRVPEPGAAHYFVRRKVEMALTLCGNHLPADSSVLEIGCSFGQMTGLLAREFQHLTAVDISPKSVEIAEKRLRSHGIHNVRFAVDDIESLLNVPGGPFDAVFSFSTLRFCPEQEKALSAILKKLKSGGLAVIDFPNRNSPWHLILKPVLGIKPHIHDRLYSAHEAAELFKQAGFTDVEVKRFLFTSRRLPRFLLPVFAILDFILERVPPFPFFAGIIMVKGVKP